MGQSTGRVSAGGPEHLYSPVLARYPQDVNLSPDFPTAAALFAKMYTDRTGTAVDGVVAIDPVALSYLLEGTGPVEVGDGVVLTSDTVSRNRCRVRFMDAPGTSDLRLSPDLLDQPLSAR